jgi:hypothetical protein
VFKALVPRFVKDIAAQAQERQARAALDALEVERKAREEERKREEQDYIL